MFDWTQKTSEEKKTAKRDFFHNWIFRATFPTQPIMHFEKTKAFLMTKMFATNHITCHTLKDYYLSS